MQMITHIRVQNFKSWADSGKVELAPLTGFFGTNSSGKSSLLQMLLLLKQSIEQEDVANVIFLGDENSLVNLGNFQEVVHGHQEEELIELEFGCKLQSPFTVETPRLDRYGDFKNSTLDVESFAFNVAIWGKGKSVIIRHSCYAVGDDNDLKMKWKDGSLWYSDQQERDVKIRSFYRLTGSRREDLLRRLAILIDKLFDQVHSIGPTRVCPQRLYHWEGTHPESVGRSGEDMIDSILNARVDQQTTSYEGQNVPIEERISAWLQEMDLAYSFSIKRTISGTDRDFDVLIQKGLGSTKVTLADMGYGLSQFLPVLVLCYYAPEGSTLILEQPGIHLHPMVQSQLADLLIEVVNERKLQVLVESHSEHLLNRLQRRIAEEKN